MAKMKRRGIEAESTGKRRGAVPVKYWSGRLVG